MTRQESFADKALQWKLAAEEKAEATQETKEEDEAVEKGDDEVDDETAEKRDLAKARKFKRLSDGGCHSRIISMRLWRRPRHDPPRRL